MTAARHLYVHLPFCAHRCGYCDFVTVVGHAGDHGAYVDALLTELELERGLLGDLDTIFLGGGTPTVTEPSALARLLAGLPPPPRPPSRPIPRPSPPAWPRCSASTGSTASRSARRASSRTCSRRSSAVRARRTCASR